MTADAVVYRFKPGSRLPTSDAQFVGEYLDRLATASGGQLSAARIVAEAKISTSPLHGFFTWDDAVAANRWREHEARHLLNCITVVVKQEKSDKEQEVRAYHVVRSSEPEEDERPVRAYIPISRVANNPAMADQVIEQAKADLRIWKDRYEKFKVLIPKFGEEFEPVFRLAS